ncbi:MAG: hypothetical protein V4721_12945 [Bacteroidota bacterium]
MEISHPPIPKQKKGAQSNTISRVQHDSLSEACVHYAVVKGRLFDVNNWGEISNNLAEFKLADPVGNLKDGIPEKGDLIRINLPAPGTETSGDYEWVRIEYILIKKSIMADNESAAIIVRPAENPETKDGQTAHFFKEDATSTFIVERRSTTISAEVHGRNENPNTSVNSLYDKLRNLIVSIGAILGFSKVQWKSFVNGLIQLEHENTINLKNQTD